MLFWLLMLFAFVATADEMEFLGTTRLDAPLINELALSACATLFDEDVVTLK